MKNYIVGYALLAMASTALVQTMQEGAAETMKLVLKKAANIKGDVTVAVAAIENDKIDLVYAGQIAVLNDNMPEKELDTMPQNDKKRVLLVSSAQEGELVLKGTYGFSMMDLRRNPNIEFKTIPTNCTGTIVCTISKALIGKLKIEFNKDGATCTPTTKVGKAYRTAKTKAGRAGASAKQKAGDAGDWLSEKGTAAYEAAGEAGDWVARQGKAAYGAAKKAAGSAKRGFGSALESAGKTVYSAGASLTPGEEADIKHQYGAELN